MTWDSISMTFLQTSRMTWRWDVTVSGKRDCSAVAPNPRVTWRNICACIVCPPLALHCAGQGKFLAPYETPEVHCSLLSVLIRVIIVHSFPFYVLRIYFNNILYLAGGL